MTRVSGLLQLGQCRRGYAVSPPAVGTSPVTSTGCRSTETQEMFHVPYAGVQVAMRWRIRQETTTLTTVLVRITPPSSGGDVDSEDFRG